MTCSSYRRLGLMLKRHGTNLNAKKLYRLYKEERLTDPGAAVARGLSAPERQ